MLETLMVYCLLTFPSPSLPHDAPSSPDEHCLPLLLCLAAPLMEKLLVLHPLLPSLLSTMGGTGSPAKTLMLTSYNPQDF